jgi:formylglycine-generating enzyme required for sulfatase activity
MRWPWTLEAFEFAGVKYPELNWRTQLQRLDHPVVAVSWQDANAYIAWLREVTRQPDWRLPSEAQWEKAARWDARATASRNYPWGDSFDKERCNTSQSGIGFTTPVGSYPASDERRSGASPSGAEEMAGNVWEWTSSLYKPYKYSESDGRESPESTENRTLRGGSWDYVAWGARGVPRHQQAGHLRSQLRVPARVVAQVGWFMTYSISHVLHSSSCTVVGMVADERRSRA